jgi:hypothetical protein
MRFNGHPASSSDDTETTLRGGLAVIWLIIPLVVVPTMTATGSRFTEC